MSWSPVTSVEEPAARPYHSSRVSKHDISFLVDGPQKPKHSHSSHSHSHSHSRNMHYIRRPAPPARPQSFASSPISSSSSVTCKHCSFVASSQDDLASHIRSAHRVKPFACKVCDKTFAERGNANKHYRVAHLKQRNHRCQTCDRCFAFRDGLNRHISMVHLNQRPFECTECMCPRGPHPPTIPCTHICGMRFKQKSHRRRHVLSVHHAASKRPVPSSSAYSHPPLLSLTAPRTGHVA